MWEKVWEKVWRGADVKRSRCEDEKVWRWEDVKMRRCEDEQMWRWEGVKMRRCKEEGVKMRRCEEEQMWRGADVKMRRCEDDEDEKMWRWEDEQMWRWEGVREGVKMRRWDTDPHYWKNPALRRSRELNNDCTNWSRKKWKHTTGWWYTYPSEKYESVGMMKFPICGENKAYSTPPTSTNPKSVQILGFP